MYEELGVVYVVVSEGINDGKGNYIAAGGSIDAFGHAQLSGAGETLKRLVEENLGIKARCNTLALPSVPPLILLPRQMRTKPLLPDKKQSIMLWLGKRALWSH